VDRPCGTVRRGAAGVVAALAASACAQGPEPLPEELRTAAAGIDAAAIAGDVAVLAADSLEGRRTGTPGFAKAADHVAARFAALGLRPAGGDGTWFQDVEFRQAELVDDGATLRIVQAGEVDTLRPYVDYYFRPDRLRETVDVAAPLVFGGFGVTAPELGHDDYAEIDVRGKVVVLFRGAPPSFPHDERAHFSSSREKRRNARDRGAVGVLWMQTPEREASRPFATGVKTARIPGMGSVDDAGGVVDEHPELRVEALLSREGMAVVFAGSPKPLDEILADVQEGKPGAFDLPASVSARRVSRLSTVHSPNVAGLLPGSDPARSGEIVVLTAHLDHLGVGEPADGDSIFNGAFDNASGSAILLEVARAFASLRRAPARSLLFLAVTGEEMGLLGSSYFAEHPTVPRETIVANLNVDMVTMLFPLQDVVAFGAEHSSLAAPLERAARHRGLVVSPDPVPQEVIFVRSDQYSFVRKGIPALYVIPGAESGSPDVDGLAVQKAWRSDVYHSPRDDLDQDIVWETGAEFARLVFLLASFVADARERPVWNEGDFFGERFGGPMAAAGTR